MQEKNSGIGEKERIVEIEVERLREFRGHPFKVKPDDQMNMLMESIKKYGISGGSVQLYTDSEDHADR